MYYRQVPQINADIDRTRKAIVTLGCSFVQGQGAVDDSLYEEYEWDFYGVGVPITVKATLEQKKEIIKRYPNTEITQFNDNIDFTFMEYDNAFGNVLAKKYFEGEYTSINLGIRGGGNRGTIKELYFHPEINWHKLDEIIVIYCPSGMERISFVSDEWREHNHWATMWPHYKNISSGARKILSEGYSKRLSSEKFEIIEQIANVQELLTWCKVKNAKLIITPAFSNQYTKEHFMQHLFIMHERDIEGNLLRSVPCAIECKNDDTAQILAEQPFKETYGMMPLWPWENMFYPDEYPTFVELCMGQEFSDWKYQHFFEFNGSGSPKKWITPCAHPAAKGHDLFAKKLYEHINTLR